MARQGISLDYLWSDTARIQVGQNTQPLVIHEEFISKESPILEAALLPQWRRAAGRANSIIDMNTMLPDPNLDPWLMHMLISYCYGNELYIVHLLHGMRGLEAYDRLRRKYWRAENSHALNLRKNEPEGGFDAIFITDAFDDGPDGNCLISGAEVDHVYINLIRLYALADFLGVETLMEELYEMYIQGSDEDGHLGEGTRTLQPEAMALAWELLPENDRLRKRVLYDASRWMTRSAWDQVKDLVPQDFAEALLMRMFAGNDLFEDVGDEPEEEEP